MYTFFSGYRLQNGSPYAIGPLSVCPVCLPVTLVAQATLCLEGDPASPCQKRGHSPQFSAHVCCGQRLDGSRCHLVRRYRPRLRRH